MIFTEHRLNKVRVKGARYDALAVRRQLERALAADWIPATLPPAAIVVIRQFRAPRLTASLTQHSGAASLRAWEQRTASQLDQFIRHAAWPARAAVAANAEVIIFADRAELLACLAADWCQGITGARWWWRSLLPAAAPANVVAQWWRATPEYIPAALALLANQERVAEFVRRLSADEARALRQSLTTRFALAAVEQELIAIEAALAQGNAITAPHKLTALWLPYAPECAALPFAAQALAGVGLLLARAPRVLRARSFCHALAQQRAELVRRASTNRDESKSLSPSATVRATQQAAEAQQSSGWLKLAPPSPTGATDKLADDLRRAPLLTLVPQAAQPARPFANILPPPMTAAGIEQAASLPMSDLTLAAQQIETAYGGVFYLINLGLFLHLYGDFTTPLRPGLELSLWDFVALLGAQLVGAPLRDDPVWALLAQLAGRAVSAAPGGDCLPPAAWRVPTEWLAPFADDEAEQWRRALQLDGAPADDGGARLWAEPKNDGAAWQQWLGRLLPYLRARLRLALGLQATDDLAAVLCAHRARVTVTATHLDVWLRLCELPLSIRLAGLDRDPGWVPAAGRYVAFHFEEE